MNAFAPPPSPLPPMQRARGQGRLSARLVDGRTCLETLYEDGAAKIRLPRSHAERLDAVLINTAGGLCGGDDLRWEVTAREATHLVLTTQACERVYRTRAEPARIASRLVVEAGARLDWLPQETILFENAALERRLDIALAPGATLLALEAVLLGRDAMGEDAFHARLADAWAIRRGGKLLHAEATRLGDGPALERQSLSLLAGGRAFATLVFIGPDAARQHEALMARPSLPGLGISLIEDRLVVRALSPNGLDLRRKITPIVSLLSAGGAVPRLWTT